MKFVSLILLFTCCETICCVCRNKCDLTGGCWESLQRYEAGDAAERQRECENRWRQTCAEGWQFDGILALFHEITVAADAAKLPTAVRLFCDLGLHGLAGLLHTHTHTQSFTCAEHYICVCERENNASCCFFSQGRVVCRRWITFSCIFTVQSRFTVLTEELDVCMETFKALNTRSIVSFSLTLAFEP